MKIYFGIKQLEKRLENPALTIGNFDGVHLGHQALFRKVVELASKRQAHSVALTFDPHPLQVLRPENPPKLISTFEQKIEQIEHAGIDILICLPFTMELAATTATDFVEKILVRAIGIKDLVIGYDYALGRGREGNIDFLRKKGREFGYSTHVVPAVEIDGMVVSSTNVRRLVSQGEMRKVARLLGRYYQTRGIVQKGMQRGGPVVGFPTANLKINNEDLCPRPGVYVVQAIYDTHCYGGVVNIGVNPTFGDQELRAEVHIFDFNRDIYGHPLKVNLIQRIRDEKRFSGPEELRAQICRDVKQARVILAAEEDLDTACYKG